MSFVIHHRYGNSETAEYVSDVMIADLLAELDVDHDDVEHGDVWLSESLPAWTLGVFAGDRHLVVLQNTDPGGDAFHQLFTTGPWLPPEPAIASS